MADKTNSKTHTTAKIEVGVHAHAKRVCPKGLFFGAWLNKILLSAVKKVERDQKRKNK